MSNPEGIAIDGGSGSSTSEGRHTSKVALSRRLGLALLAALAVGAHAASLGNGFVFDDPAAVLRNPTVTGPLSLDRLAHHDFWGRARDAADSVGTWRPLPTLTFWLDWRLGGGRPWPFHAGNVLWHALAALALALALERAGGDRGLALGAAGLWALLAANGEAVASVVGRADVMAAAFGFVAWRLWRTRLAAAVAAYVAACLCKESAIVLPVWLFAVEHLLDAGAARRRPRAFFALAAAGLGYALLRTVVFQPFSHVQLAHYSNPLLGASHLARLWTGLRLLLLTLRVILVPLNLSADYSGWQLEPGHTPAWEAAAGALAFVVLVAVAVRLRRRDPALSAGIALFLVTWGMVSNIVVLLPTIFAERLLYLPSAGLALVLARLGQHALARRPSAAATLLAAVAAANLALAVGADRMWHDELALFRATVEVSPKSARAWFNYGVGLTHAGRRADALAAYRQSLALGASADTLTAIGVLFDELGRPAEAQRWLDAAVKLDPDDRKAVRDAAIFYARYRGQAHAAALLAPYVGRHPDDAELAALLRRVESDAR